MLQEAESPPILSSKSETVYAFMYPEECTLTDSHSGTSGEEELDYSEDEDDCQGKWQFLKFSY